jgi:hypothetical protein
LCCGTSEAAMIATVIDAGSILAGIAALAFCIQE